MSGFKAAGGRRGSEVVGCHGEAPTLGGLDRLKDMLGKNSELEKANAVYEIVMTMSKLRSETIVFVSGRNSHRV